MMLDMLVAIARKNYEDRRLRTTQGIAQAKERDKPKPQAKRDYKGRPASHERNTAILAMLDKGSSWSELWRQLGPRAVRY